MTYRLFFFFDVVRTVLGNYTGSFMKYDEKNKKTTDRLFMRIDHGVNGHSSTFEEDKESLKPGSDWIV